MSDRVTRSRNLSAGHEPEESYLDQEPRPVSRASSSDTLIADSSGPSVWSIADSVDAEDFASSIDITSTQRIRLPHPNTLPPPVAVEYSPTEFDQTGFFHSAIEMANEDEQGAGGGQRRVPIPAAQGMSPDLMAMMQMFQQQRADDNQQRREDLAAQEARYQQQRADDLKREKEARQEHVLALAALQAQSHDAIRTLGDEVKRLAVRGPDTARPTSIKLPIFDLERDRGTFKQWKDRWQMHIRAHRIHLIADEEERQERCLTELTAALSDETLKWIANRDFTQEERANPDALVQAFEDHIRESTNPTVTVVELFTMKRHQHETADHLNARINEKLNEVDFSVITDIRDYFGMTATIIANDPALRKRMY